MTGGTGPSVCDLNSEVVPSNHNAVAGYDLDVEAVACASSSTLGGRAAAEGSGLDAKAKAVNQAVWRDFFVDPATATRASSSTSGE